MITAIICVVSRAHHVVRCYDHSLQVVHTTAVLSPPAMVACRAPGRSFYEGKADDALENIGTASQQEQLVVACSHNCGC